MWQLGDQCISYLIISHEIQNKDLSFGYNALHCLCVPSCQLSVKENLQHGISKKKKVCNTSAAIRNRPGWSNVCRGQWKFTDPIPLTIHGWVTDRCCKKTRRQGWLARGRSLPNLKIETVWHLLVKIKFQPWTFCRLMLYRLIVIKNFFSPQKALFFF